MRLNETKTRSQEKLPIDACEGVKYDAAFKLLKMIIVFKIPNVYNSMCCIYQ